MEDIDIFSGYVCKTDARVSGVVGPVARLIEFAAKPQLLEFHTASTQCGAVQSPAADPYSVLRASAADVSAPLSQSCSLSLERHRICCFNARQHSLHRFPFRRVDLELMPREVL